MNFFICLALSLFLLSCSTPQVRPVGPPPHPLAKAQTETIPMKPPDQVYCRNGSTLYPCVITTPKTPITMGSAPASGPPLTAPSAPPPKPAATKEQIEHIIKTLVPTIAGIAAQKTPHAPSFPHTAPASPKPPAASHPHRDVPPPPSSDPSIPLTESKDGHVPPQFMVDTTPPTPQDRTGWRRLLPSTVIEEDISAKLTEIPDAPLQDDPPAPLPKAHPSPTAKSSTEIITSPDDSRANHRTLLGSVYFESNSTTLDPSEQVVLIDLLSQIEKKNLLLIGYSDRLGDKDLNSRIAFKRARAVKAFYVTTGTKQETIFTASKGSCCFKTKGKTDADRRRNRRVEIYHTTESFPQSTMSSPQEN